MTKSERFLAGRTSQSLYYALQISQACRLCHFLQHMDPGVCVSRTWGGGAGAGWQKSSLGVGTPFRLAEGDPTDREADCAGQAPAVPSAPGQGQIQGRQPWSCPEASDLLSGRLGVSREPGRSYCCCQSTVIRFSSGLTKGFCQVFCFLHCLHLLGPCHGLWFPLRKCSSRVNP